MGRFRPLPQVLTIIIMGGVGAIFTSINNDYASDFHNQGRNLIRLLMVSECLNLL